MASHDLSMPLGRRTLRYMPRSKTDDKIFYSIGHNLDSIGLYATPSMPEDSHSMKRNYEWDPEQNMFVPQNIPDQDDAGDASDLSTSSIERLAMLPEWLVPLDRKNELVRYKTSRDREARAKLQEDMKSKDIRGQKLTISTESSGVLNRKPEVLYGPRGGRYTIDTTRSGRPYKRYCLKQVKRCQSFIG